MAVKMRLARRGRRKRPFYHIVIADARSPRDGKFIEQIGSYNPMTSPATIEIDSDKAFDWLNKGAQPTNTVNAILKFKGVLYKKHLQRGVDKGALTQEKADQLLADWIESKEAKVNARKEAAMRQKENVLKKISGEVKAVANETASEEDKAAFRDIAEEAPVVEEAPATETEAKTEEVPAVEEAPTAETETTKEEAPVVEEAPAAEMEAKTEETSAVEEAATDAKEEAEANNKEE